MTLNSTLRRRAASAFTLFLLSAPTVSRAQETLNLTTSGAGTTAIVTQTAPIFLAPDASRQPLRVAREGSRLRVIDQDNGWLTVQFQDPQFGLRTGYIESRYVRVEPLAALQPMDLSVSETPRAAAAPAAAPPAPAPGAREALGTAAAAEAPRVDADGRQSVTDRFWLGVGLEGNGLLANDALNSSTDSGRGIGLSAGYGFTPRWALYAALGGASMTASDFSGTYALGHFDLGTRLHFRNESRRVRPFVQAGLSGRAVTQDFYVGSRAYRVEASGAGVSFGGGLNAHFTPALAFSGGITWSVGNFSVYKVNGLEVPVDSLGATSARVHLGLVWFPGARR